MNYLNKVITNIIVSGLKFCLCNYTVNFLKGREKEENGRD